MSSICAKIASGIVFDCDDPLIAGVEAETLVLFNYDDVDRSSSVISSTNPQALEVLSLIGSPVQTLGYVFEGVNNSVRPSGENVTDGFNPFKFTHTLEFRIFDRSVAAKKIVRELAAGSLVAVYFRKGKTVEVMGFDVGLSNNTVTFNEYEEEGAYLLTLSTDSDGGEFEPKLPLTFIGTGSPAPTFEQLKNDILQLT
jgi:hypothetical protein